MDDFSLILVAFLLGALLAFLLQNSSFLSPPPKAVFIPNGPSSGEYKMVFLIRTDLQMSKGKVAAQCCHACLSAYQTALKGSAAQQSWVREWESIGQAKITLKVDSEKEMLELQKQARKSGLVAQSIMDAGRTQIAAGSRTVLAIGPAPVEHINVISGHLKLF